MKIKGKQVVEIRPMTRGEYIDRHKPKDYSSQFYCERMFGTGERCWLFNDCKDCYQHSAKVNGKWQMLVRCKK